METSSKGWIALHRAILDKPIWLNSSPEQKSILVTLLLMANHEANSWEWQGKQFEVQPGQFITSIDSIVKKAGKGISQQNVRTALKRFEKLNFLTNESTKQNRLITIDNWAFYQGRESEPNKATNSQLTDTSQTPNRRLTTNNNDLTMINNVKQDDIDDDRKDFMKNIINLYEKMFGPINPIKIQTLDFWVKDLSEEIVLEALNRSANARSFSYTESVLKNWEKNGVKNLADIEKLDAEFTKKSKADYKRMKGSVPDEELPETGEDW